MVEHQVGGVWLQFGESPGGCVFRIGVPDLQAERARLLALGVDVGDIEVVDGVIAFCDFADLDGNRLSFYTLSAIGRDN